MTTRPVEQLPINLTLCRALAHIPRILAKLDGPDQAPSLLEVYYRNVEGMDAEAIEEEARKYAVVEKTHSKKRKCKVLSYRKAS